MKRRHVLAFGLSGLANNLVATCVGVHLLMFYTDVVGLAPLWVSAGLVIATIWDAISDLWMGRISDATRWRAGRRRPYILIGALPAAAAFALLLAPPALEGGALGLFLVGVLLALFTATTVVQVPALSLLPEMAKGYDERTRLATARELFGNVGDLLGLMLPPLFLVALGADRGTPDAGERAREAFAGAAAVGGLVMLGALAATWLGTREDPSVRPDTTPLREALAALRQNQPFRALMGASVLAALGLAIVNTLVLHVFVHVLRFESPVIHMAAFAVNAGAAIASYPFWSWLARTKGKPFAFRAGLALTMVTFASVFVVGPGNLVGLCAVMVFGGAANVGCWMLMSSLAADVTDVDELASGQRREGLFAGFTALLRKGATAAALGLVGVGLWLVDYQAGAPAQTPETVLGLELLFAVPPTALILGALFVFRDFRLGRAEHAEIVEVLGARRAARAHAVEPESARPATIPSLAATP